MMPTCIDTLSVEGRLDFFNSFDNVLTDCDGVLWLDNITLPGATQVMNGFKNNDKNISFVTNSNTKTRAQLLEKFLLLGFLSSVNEVISSGFLAARYLKDNLDPSKQVYVIGTPALASELNALDVKNFGVGEDYLNTSVSEFVDKLKLEPNVGAVLVGFDDYFSYPKIFKAASYLKDQNVLFVATNMDEIFPIARNSSLVMPATGTLVTPVKVSAGRDPFVIGKPSSYICDFLMESNKIDPSRTLMIGDRCSTDIIFGKRCGFRTLLVLTGVNSLKDVEEWNKSDDPTLQELVPDYYAEGIDSLRKIFPVPLK